MPSLPSRKLSTLGEKATTAAQCRRTNPAKLTQLLGGELDWIVMKSLEKERDRRYESASSFAADVERFLNDEAVEACPPSTTYRLRKFVRRNRGPVLAIASLLLVLCLGLGGTSRIWSPFASSFAWGLAFATFVTLLLVPAIYCIVHDVTRLFGRSDTYAAPEFDSSGDHSSDH